MLGLLLIYFIGKAFFSLAKKHGRNKWLFAVLGVVVYYAMTFIGGTVIVLIMVMLGNDNILNTSDVVLGLLGIPIGLLSVWLFHFILRKNWEGRPKEQNSDLLDGGTF